MADWTTVSISVGVKRPVDCVVLLLVVCQLSLLSSVFVIVDDG